MRARPEGMPQPAAADWTMAQKLLVGFAALAFFADGMGTQAMGLALPSLLKAWAVPRTALAAATAWGLVGFAAGAMLGGLCGDRFGRQATLIGCLLLLGAATAGCALATAPADLALIRIFAGLGLGASLPVAAALIADATPRRHHSLVMAVGLAFLPLGGFLEGLVAADLLPSHGWQGLFVFTGVAAGIFASALWLYGLGTQGGGLVAMSDLTPTRMPFGRSIAGLLSSRQRRDTLGLWGAFFCTVLIYYSIFSWLPAAFAGQGRSVAVASGAISAFAIGGLGGGLAAGWCAQAWGSRVTLLILGIATALVGMGLAVMARAPDSDAASLILGVGALGATVIGIQTALYALGAHVYEAALRATGIGIAVGWGRVGAIASAYTGVVSLDAGGITGYFGFLAVAALLALGSALTVRRQIIGRSGRVVA